VLIFIHYPAKILEEPLVIAPLSALSPILAINEPSTLTVDDPIFTLAT
jgi:hypothetical protein